MAYLAPSCIAKGAVAHAALSPNLKALQKSWKGSKPDLLHTQQKLMQENGVRPLSSTMLGLVQSPVFLVLYRFVRQLGHPFATALIPWAPVPTAVDPLHILPLTAAILMALGTFVTYTQFHFGSPQLL